MKFFHTITFRFTLWYMGVLSLLLTLLGGGIYFSLSGLLYHNLDAALKTRAAQLEEFRDIVSIVSGGTFEEEIGEFIAFYHAAGEKLTYISHRQHKIPVDPAQVRQAITGTASFATISVPGKGNLRVYATPFSQRKRDTDTEKRVATETGGRSMDADQDGFVSIAEMTAHETRMFHRIDRDGDGSVSPREMTAHEAEKKGGRDPGPDDRFEKLDADGDGRVSRREYIADETDKFHRQDRDGDGRLSGRERENDRHRGRGRLERDRTPPPASIFTENEAAMVLARPTGAIDTALDRLRKILWGAIPLTILLSVGGGIFLARRALAPVREMTETARRIQEMDLDRQIEVTTRDELGRLGDTLNRMLQRLREALERQKQFTGDASHELRAPLAVIRAEAGLALERQRKTPEYRRCIRAIRQEADQMSGIIDQLLLLARADAGKAHLCFERFRLWECIQEVCGDMEILCREKGLVLRWTAASDPLVQGDKKSLKRLISNLVGNAIRYTHNGGTIEVALRNDASAALLTVADTGMGIPPSAQPHLFERFYRVDKARSRGMGGSGLGLAICKQIVEIHGGTIQVVSALEKGSTFSIRLPLIS